jgi:hypothetical protein
MYLLTNSVGLFGFLFKAKFRLFKNVIILYSIFVKLVANGFV